MILSYVLANGKQQEYKLSKTNITIGRAEDADLVLDDKMASRVHCGISYWDNAYFVRDFQSRNGTYVNNAAVKICQLNPGDRLQVGNTVITVAAGTKGTDTVLREVHNAMEQGKGYNTILHEIIEDQAESEKKSVSED